MRNQKAVFRTYERRKIRLRTTDARAFDYEFKIEIGRDKIENIENKMPFSKKDHNFIRRKIYEIIY